MSHLWNIIVLCYFLKSTYCAEKVELCDICKCDQIHGANIKFIISCKFTSVDWENINWPRNNENLPMELHISGGNGAPTTLSSFPYNDQLKVLNITSSNIRANTPGAFKNLPNLEHLSLCNNSLKYLSGNIFQGLQNLRSLDISENKLSEISGEVLKDLETLEEFYMKGNELIKVPVEVLSHLNNLVKLDLSSNMIFILKLNDLKLPKLKDLNLSENNLTVIASDTFSGLNALEHLNLSKNKIANVESLAFDIKTLKTIDVSHNRLSTAITLSENVQSINLEWNYYNFWPFEHSFAQLQYLNLRENNLWEVHLDDSYGKLETLLLSGNVLTKLPNVKLNELSTLDLADNDLTTLPEELDINFMPNLRNLVLSGNPIKELHFDKILHLENLQVNDMPRLKKISGLENIHGRKSVDTLSEPCVDLSISNCKELIRLQDDIFENINLCSLNLSDNALSTVPLSVPEGVELDLQNNPLACTCGLQWFLDEILPGLYKSHQNVLHDLRCDGVRLVYWYNWPGKVLCDETTNKKSDLRDLSQASTKINQRTLKSGQAFYAIAGACLAVLICLVAVGMYHTRVQTRKLKAIRRNRRLLT